MQYTLLNHAAQALQSSNSREHWEHSITLTRRRQQCPRLAIMSSSEALACSCSRIFKVHILLESQCVSDANGIIQGTMEPSAMGFKLVLFDPMTHTRTGYSIPLSPPHPLTYSHIQWHRKSDLGDHSLTGIKDFINNHECSPICRQLMLCSVEDLETTFKTLDDGDSDSNSDSE